MYLTHTVSTYLAGKAAFKDKYILDFTDDDFLTHSSGFIKKKKNSNKDFISNSLYRAELGIPLKILKMVSLEIVLAQSLQSAVLEEIYP